MSKKTALRIEGMSCGHCSNAVKNLIEEIVGVQSAQVNLGTKEVSVVFDSSTTDKQAIIEKINSSNAYKATKK